MGFSGSGLACVGTMRTWVGWLLCVAAAVLLARVSMASPIGGDGAVELGEAREEVDSPNGGEQTSWPSKKWSAIWSTLGEGMGSGSGSAAKKPGLGIKLLKSDCAKLEGIARLECEDKEEDEAKQNWHHMWGSSNGDPRERPGYGSGSGRGMETGRRRMSPPVLKLVRRRRGPASKPAASAAATASASAPAPAPPPARL